MRIAVIGCGGIGGVLAASMTRAGADVTPVVGNPKIAAALGAHGYRVRELDGSEWSVPVGRAPLLHASESAASPDPAALPALTEPASAGVVVDDLAGVRWSKLAINCVTTTLGAIGGVPLGKLLSHRPIRRIALEVFAEVAAVAQAAGVRVQP